MAPTATVTTTGAARVTATPEPTTTAAVIKGDFHLFSFLGWFCLSSSVCCGDEELLGGELAEGTSAVEGLQRGHSKGFLAKKMKRGERRT